MIYSIAYKLVALHLPVLLLAGVFPAVAVAWSLRTRWVQRHPILWAILPSGAGLLLGGRLAAVLVAWGPPESYLGGGGGFLLTVSVGALGPGLGALAMGWSPGQFARTPKAPGPQTPDGPT